MELSSLLPVPHADLVTALAYSPSSTHLLTASADASLAVFRRGADGAFVKHDQWKAHDGPVGGVAWAGEQWGLVFASWGWDRRIVVWREDVEENKNSGRRFPLLWSTALPPSLGSPQSISFPPASSSASGLLLSILTSSGALVVYSPASGAMNDWFSLVNVNLPALLAEPAAAPAAGEQPGQLGRMLSSGKSGEGKAGSAAGPAGAKKMSWCREHWWGLVFATTLDSTGTIHIFTLQNPSTPPFLLASLPIPSSSSSAAPVKDASSPATQTALAWAPSCGRSYHLIASGSRNGVVRVWRVTPFGLAGEDEDDEGEQVQGEWTGKCVAELPDHGAAVTQLEWNVTGTILSSSGDDGKTRLWKATYANRWECAAVFDAVSPAEAEGEGDAEMA